ncbi:MAG: ribosome biogenesis GTPase Der [Hyphomicrobium sp.]|uniref:ribosome biogenesis GTPase Der n=1 Tax=Hyphomicrobium sp. TaxID=82 RepID=UPI0013208B13|nr:ribosome biogenesis GTPase Der [Hyphomicrobium sp.]KAB2940644.1 MAG: ribosome biogenesis GTPase Der [Hyphomicrobium sp.]MBZ0211465.1 ribosome biogenesis GTPase Der [Hyphomicrobium sp.]
MSSPPVIAIIGRPNVGKSTLFNRLTGKRSALVSDVPGLTRDRREEEADLAGHPVTIVDTAGLEQAKRGSIAERMRQQSEAAVAAADLILFVIDAREGITPDDKSFSRLVRASGRPVVLVANKSEGRAGEEGFYAAFELGFGEPVAISAEHGEGLADLLTEMMAALGLKEAREADAEVPATARPIRVAIVGRPNAGKSTLVNAILGEERMITGPEPGLTRDSVPSDVEWSGRKIRLFDTAGLRRKAKITETAEKLSASDAIRAIRFAEVVVLLIDAERPFEHQDLTIGDLVTEEGRALVVAVNKWDLVEDKQGKLKQLRETLSERLSQVPGVALVPLSALSGRGIDKLAKAVLEAYDTWNRRVSTPDLNRWLAEALGRHAPPAVSGRRIKIRYITQPSTRPPTFIAFCSRPEELPKSYLRYLTNSLREAFDLPGVPLRINLRKGDNPFAKHKS